MEAVAIKVDLVQPRARVESPSDIASDNVSVREHDGLLPVPPFGGGSHSYSVRRKVPAKREGKGNPNTRHRSSIRVTKNQADFRIGEEPAHIDDDAVILV